MMMPACHLPVINCIKVSSEILYLIPFNNTFNLSQARISIIPKLKFNITLLNKTC